MLLTAMFWEIFLEEQSILVKKIFEKESSWNLYYLIVADLFQ